jgi:hypothetical protein
MKKFAMQFKAMWSCAFLFLMLPALSFAGGNNCAGATAVIPDGRSLELDYVAPSSFAWYQFNATANHSYSVEVRDDLDPDNADFTPTGGGNVLFYAPPVTCSTPTSNTNYTDTHLIEPAAGPHATRFSFIPTTTGAYYISVQNGSSSVGHYVTMTVSETTIYSPTWNTNSNFTTQWILQNTTSQTISLTVTLTATTVSPPEIYTNGPLTLGPSSSSTSNQILSTSGGFSPPLPTAGRVGYVMITHNGPPGAIQAYANEYNFGYPSPVLFQIPIGPMRGK